MGHSFVITQHTENSESVIVDLCQSATEQVRSFLLVESAGLTCASLFVYSYLLITIFMIWRIKIIKRPHEKWPFVILGIIHFFFFWVRFLTALKKKTFRSIVSFTHSSMDCVRDEQKATKSNFEVNSSCQQNFN